MTQTKEVDRLTAETARVGMRVRCVSASDYAPKNVVAGAFYTISQVDSDDSVRLIERGDYWFDAHRFIPAAPQHDESLRAILSERAPELLAVLADYRDYHEDTFVPPGSQHPAHELIVIARRIFADLEQPAPLPAMWCGADAFTEENDDGR